MLLSRRRPRPRVGGAAATALVNAAVAATLFKKPKTRTNDPAHPSHHPTRHSFVPRHNSTTQAELDEMVAATGFPSMDALIDATVPASIRRADGMDMGKYTKGMGESEFLAYFK